MWEHLNSIESEEKRSKLTNQLISYLPEKILLKDSKHILEVLVKNENEGASLFKIVKHLDFEMLKQTGIVGYCIQEVQEMC